ncbi:MAG TPA: hypothetical protein VJ953_03170 [Saprospiraceae bacterium]|nr:hypothetical protein [Saprospiraceae bacterium]
MKSVFKLTMLLLFASLVNCTAGTDEISRREYTKTIKKEFDIAANGTTYLSNKYGEVTVKTWDRNRVKISVNIVVDANSEDKANDVFDRITVNFSNARDYVRAITEIESSRSSWWSWGSSSSKGDYKINYEVYLPTSNNLDLELKYGDAYVANMEGKVKLNLKYANFKVEGVGDDSTIDFAYGNGAIQKARDLTTSLSYGKLDIEQVNDISLTTKYSKINIERAGDVRCETKYDTYRLMEVADFKNYGKYDNFSIQKVRNVSLEGKYSSIEAEEVSQRVDLDMEYGSASFGLSRQFQEASMNGKYTDFKVNVASGAAYRMDAMATYAGISYPSNFEVVKEISKSSSQEVEGYSLKSNAQATITARLNYGGLRVRTN